MASSRNYSLKIHNPLYLHLTNMLTCSKATKLVSYYVAVDDFWRLFIHSLENLAFSGFKDKQEALLKTLIFQRASCLSFDKIEHDYLLTLIFGIYLSNSV